AKGPAHLAILHLEGENVTLHPPAGGFPQDFLVAGTPAKSQSLRAEGNKDRLAPRMIIGTLNMYVIRRESRFALRIKDAQSPSITGFHGLKWYPPDENYRVIASGFPMFPSKPSRSPLSSARTTISPFRAPRNLSSLARPGA